MHTGHGAMIQYQIVHGFEKLSLFCTIEKHNGQVVKRRYLNQSQQEDGFEDS